MKKIFLILIGILLYFLLTPITVHAQTDWQTEFQYEVQDSYWCRFANSDVIEVHAADHSLLFNCMLVNETKYTTTNVWIRHYPTTTEGRVMLLPQRTELIEYARSEIGWSIVFYQDRAYYIWYDYLSDEPVINEADLRLLSSIIYCEAGNQCEAGKYAVGWVIINRTENDKFPDTISGVIYAPDQFGPVSDGKLQKALERYDKNTLPQECIDIATEVLLCSDDRVVDYNGNQIDCSNLLFFNGTWPGYKVKIQDHEFA